MENLSPKKPIIDPSKISRPIPLLALMAIIFEIIVGIIAYYSNDKPFFPIIAIALIILPVFLICLIYRLLTVHSYRLYAPDQFPNPDDFMKIFNEISRNIENIGNTPKGGIFKPLGHDNEIDSKQAMQIKNQISVVEGLLESISAKDFMIFHSWFNREGRHDNALVCIDIAISKGASYSRHFSYRSASLRKLGRLQEAIHSVEIALGLEPNDPDALYNLARIYIAKGNQQDANRIFEKIKKNGEIKYVDRLLPFMKTENT